VTSKLATNSLFPLLELFVSSSVKDIARFLKKHCVGE